MESLPSCPKCQSEYTYEDGPLMVCPECGFEWTPASEEDLLVRDSNGNVLKTGDSIIIIKDLKIKGASSVLKRGTKVKNIRVIEGKLEDGGHDLEGKVDGIGAIYIKAKYVKK